MPPQHHVKVTKHPKAPSVPKSISLTDEIESKMNQSFEAESKEDPATHWHKTDSELKFDTQMSRSLFLRSTTPVCLSSHLPIFPFTYIPANQLIYRATPGAAFYRCTWKRSVQFSDPIFQQHQGDDMF